MIKMLYLKKNLKWLVDYFYKLICYKKIYIWIMCYNICKIFVFNKIMLYVICIVGIVLNKWDIVFK